MTTELETNERLAVTAKELAEMLGVSERHVWGMLTDAKIPQPVSLGRCKRWRVAEIQKWLEAGCPPQ